MSIARISTKSPSPTRVSFEAAVIPRPLSLNIGTGSFRLDASTIIVAGDNALPEARLLADILSRSTGVSPAISKIAGRIPNGTICLTVEPEVSLATDPKNSVPSRFGRGGEERAGAGSESYRLQVTPTHIMITASTPAGAFYGVQTLLQLLPPEALAPSRQERSAWSIPCCVIDDEPRFAWRGAMLDVARHFMPTSFVKKLIDLLAFHKLNTLHLHLSDDQGWRLEIKKHPKLTQVGGRRDATLSGRCTQDPADKHFDPDKDPLDDKPHGGYYTQEEARELVEYARARHVTIVPEIDIPGHAQAMIAAYPELGCVDADVSVSPRWGIHPFVLAPHEQTFQFLEDVFGEVMDIFPSPFIHIGGDEVVKDQWRGDPSTMRRAAELGLKDETELHAYFVKRMSRFIASHGRRLVGWDEILDSELSPGTVVMSWRGVEGGKAGAAAGFDVVMAPHDKTYYDYRQSAVEADEPLAFRLCTTLDDVYAYDPVPDELPPAHRHKIIGTQGQLWTEYVPTPEHAEYMLFPRLIALAEVAWSDPDHCNYADFLRRLRGHERRMDQLDVNYRPL